MASRQHSKIVTQQFEHQMQLYGNKSVRLHSPISLFLIRAFRTYKRNAPELSICEFGGGGGQVLAEIEEGTKRHLKLLNAELTKGFKTHQASQKITFKTISLLDSGFVDNSFDAVCVRHVIHHLIGDSLAETRKNQRVALRELVRVTKPGGFIVIEEQVNCSAVATHLYFYLSRLATKFKLSIKAFQITPYTIVGYLTRKELLAMAKLAVPKKHWIEERYDRWPPEWWWRMTMLMNNTGAEFLVMKKPDW